MAEYALVGPADEIKTFARDVKPDVGTKPGWRWLPVERPDHQYDPETQALEPQAVTVHKDRVVVSRAARDLTEGEFEQQKSAEIDNALPPLLLSILTDLENRVRLLEGKPTRSEDELRSTARRLIG